MLQLRVPQLAPCRPSVFAPFRTIQTKGQRRCIVSVAASAAPAEAKARATPKRTDVITGLPDNNVTDYIFEKMGENLHQRPDHPIGIIKSAICDYFEARNPGVFQKLDDLYPVVSTTANFDEMLVPADHISRSPNDTYYVSSDTVLRCHTSAHQVGMEHLRFLHSTIVVESVATPLFCCQ